MAGTGLDELAWEPGSGPDLSFTTELAVTQSFLYLGLYLSSDLLRPHFGWGFSREARRGSQGASRAAPGKSGLPARSEEERVVALE